MRRLILLALVAACGPSDYADFRQQYVSRTCDNARRCGRIGHSDPCPVPSSLPTAGLLDVPSAVSDGKLQFRSDKAQDCLDQLPGAPCNEASAALRIYEHCHAVLGANVAVGGNCDDDIECVGGTCDGAGGCSGHCVAFPAPHSPCIPGECDPTVQYCGGGDPPTCLLHKSEGATCAADDECDYPFFCAAGKCRHYPRTSDGNPCTDPAAVCNDGSYCAPGGVCTPLHNKGAPCEAAGTCKRGDGCGQFADAGVCQPWSDEGLPCAPGLCPSTQACGADRDAGNADAGTVGLCGETTSLPGGPGESCEMRDCAGGLYCDASKLCQFMRLVGGDCTPASADAGDGCAPGLTCDAQTRRCTNGASCSSFDAGTRD